MSRSVNKVILVGNCTRDPEVKNFNNGGRVCNLTVATSERWKSKETGEWKERSEFNRVVIFNDGLVGVAEKFLRKGSKVYIEGQLETRKFERDGREQFTTEVVLRPYRGELTLLDGKQDGEGGSQGGDYSGSYGSSRQSAAPAGLDDEIPF